MIDLHTHTTASDGSLPPAELVNRAASVGIRTLAVTDHDTLAGIPEAAGAARARGLAFVAGIEITAVHEHRDVHMLGYFLRRDPPGVGPFLETARRDRARRARAMSDKLAALGAPVDIEDLIQEAEESGRAVARPTVARALVDAGHVRSMQEAFDRYLADGGSAYVARTGASPAEVVALVRAGGGICSLAHPGLLRKDHLIPGLVDAGLDAIEAFHSEHGAADRARYRRLAERNGLAISGGSDFHGEGHHRADRFGRVGLPEAHFGALRCRLERAHAAVHGETGPMEFRLPAAEAGMAPAGPAT